MGFLKFLKREKRESFDELDLPPAPPLLGNQTESAGYGFEENMPELPEFPELEKISAPDGMPEMPKFEFPEEEMGKEEMPEFPAFPEIEESPSAYPAPARAPMTEPSIPQPMTSRPMPVSEAPEEEQPMPSNIYPKMGRRLFAQEKRLLRERPNVRTIYVRIDDFKSTLGSISMARGDLKKSEEALAKLENIKSAKDKSLDRAKNLLDDLQKKLIFVDKTLFKGE